MREKHSCDCIIGLCYRVAEKKEKKFFKTVPVHSKGQIRLFFIHRLCDSMEMEKKNNISELELQMVCKMWPEEGIAAQVCLNVMIWCLCSSGGSFIAAVAADL